MLLRVFEKVLGLLFATPVLVSRGHTSPAERGVATRDYPVAGQWQQLYLPKDKLPGKWYVGANAVTDRTTTLILEVQVY